MSRLYIRTLGEPAFIRDGVVVPLPASRKTRALLFLLLLSGRAWRRDQLCEMFWNVPNDPRAALRWSLTKLRHALGEQAGSLVADRDRVACRMQDVVIDLDRMAGDLGTLDAETLLALADSALDAPMLGLDLAGNGDYTAWLAGIRVRADRLRVRILLAAANHAHTPPDRAVRFLGAAREAAPDDSRIIDATQGSGSEHTAAGVVDTGAAELRQSTRFLQTGDGTRIAYAVTGSGPPLVKAANWLNHLELDWESPLWGRLFQELSMDRRLVRYDERGNGLSQWDVADMSFDAFVSDLEQVVDQLGLERFPLLGISQGCAVSIEYAVRHPERVSALVLIGGYAAGWRIVGDERLSEEREATMTLVRHGWGQDNPAYRQIFSHSFFPGGNASELAWFSEFQRRTTSTENAVRFLDTFSTIDVRHRLRDVVARTLILHSRGDQRISLDHATELATGIPGAALVTLDSDSHVPLDRESAHARMVACIRTFLAHDE